MSHPEERRELLIDLYRAGLARVEGRRCVQEALSRPAGRPEGRVWAVAIGKAASAMALGARDVLGEGLEALLLVTRRGHVAPELRELPGVEIHEGGHPLPDERSLRAGQRLLRWLEGLPPGVTPLFLISGGASALVEVPQAGVTLEALVRVSREGLASDLDIAALNRRRAGLSQIKGGRLAVRLGGRPAQALLISDVPDDDPAVIGSGILAPAPGGDRVQRQVIASLDMAIDAVVTAASARQLAAQRAARRFAGDASRLAVQFTHELALGQVQVRVWGGESTVRLPEHPGRGGRNQHLALAAARMIAGYPELMLLAAGTDGTDGATDDAGAVVDADTCGQIALLGLDPEECLRRADSGAALQAVGALLCTGPTGTNVADLAIGLKLPDRGASRETHPAR